MTVSLTYNSFSLMTNGVIITDFNGSLPRRIALNDIEMRHGKILVGSPVLDARRIPLSGSIVADDETTLRARIRAFGKAMGIGGAAKFNLYSDYYVMARVENFTRRPKLLTGLLWEWSLDLVCDDPFWTAETPTTDATVVVTSPKTWTHDNEGTYLVYPVLTLTAPTGALGVTNPRYTNSTTGKFAEFTGTLAPGSTVVIDCGKGLVTIGGVSYLNYFNGSFISLSPDDNSMSFSWTGDTPTQTMVYRKRHIED